MCAFIGIFPGIKSSDALLKRKKTFVYFSTFKTALSVVALTVGCSLASSQINEQ
jgi:hypothetical protein